MKEKILEILANDSRIPKKRIASMLGITEEEVCRYLEEMEKDKVILKYTTVTDWEKVENMQRVTALINVEVQPQRDVGFNDIARRICGFPEVKSMMLMSGEHDFTVMVEGKTMLDVSRFVWEKLATIDGVRKTGTNFVLKNYKLNDVIFEDETNDHRQAVTP